MANVRCVEIKRVKLDFTLKIEGKFRRSRHFFHDSTYGPFKNNLFS